MLACGFAEGVDHDPAGDALMCADVEGVAGVVVEPSDDLGVLTAAEREVGEVGLPGLVGLLGSEADVGGLGPLLRLGGDQALPGQGARDGAEGDLELVVVLEVPGAGLGAGVESGLGQSLADPDDQVDARLRDRSGASVGSPGPWCEGGIAFCTVAGQQFIDPGLRDAVGGDHLRDAASFDLDSGDD